MRPNQILGHIFQMICNNFRNHFITHITQGNWAQIIDKMRGANVGDKGNISFTPRKRDFGDVEKVSNSLI